MAEVRLQAHLARAGLASSRRKAEELIKAGKVFVNGKPAVLGTKIDPKEDKITFIGGEVETVQNRLYIMLNKPADYLVAKSDARGRKLVYDLLRQSSAAGKKLSEAEFNSVFNIGRLDLNCEGLLLFTNDGQFADAIIHPRAKINKTYIAKVEGKITEEKIGKLLRGVQVVAEQDGKEVKYLSHFKTIRVLGRGEYSVLVIKISEGKKRQIRRTLEAVGHKVIALKRVSVGSLKLGELPLGKWRFLTEKEIMQLST